MKKIFLNLSFLQVLCGCSIVNSGGLTKNDLKKSLKYVFDGHNYSVEIIKGKIYDLKPVDSYIAKRQIDVDNNFRKHYELEKDKFHYYSYSAGYVQEHGDEEPVWREYVTDKYFEYLDKGPTIIEYLKAEYCNCWDSYTKSFGDQTYLTDEYSLFKESYDYNLGYIFTDYLNGKIDFSYKDDNYYLDRYTPENSVGWSYINMYISIDSSSISIEYTVDGGYFKTDYIQTISNIGSTKVELPVIDK